MTAGRPPGRSMSLAVAAVVRMCLPVAKTPALSVSAALYRQPLTATRCPRARSRPQRPCSGVTRGSMTLH